MLERINGGGEEEPARDIREKRYHDMHRHHGTMHACMRAFGETGSFSTTREQRMFNGKRAVDKGAFCSLCLSPVLSSRSSFMPFPDEEGPPLRQARIGVFPPIVVAPLVMAKESPPPPPPQRRQPCHGYACFFSSDFVSLVVFILVHLAKDIFMEDKPYACDMPGCTQRYSNLSNMRRHQRAKHGRKGCRRPPSQAMTLENEPRCPQGAGEVQQLQREVMRGERGSVHDVPVLSSSAVSEADMGPSAPLRRRQHHHHQQMEEEEDTSIPSRPQEMPGRRGGALVFSGEEDGGAALSRVVDHTAALKEAGIDPADVTVLVVDDEPSSRRVAGRFLKSAGYNVLQGAFLSFRPPPLFFSLFCALGVPLPGS